MFRYCLVLSLLFFVQALDAAPHYHVLFLGLKEEVEWLERSFVPKNGIEVLINEKDNKQIKIFDPKTPWVVRVLNNSHDVKALALNYDGTLLAIAYHNHVEMYDLEHKCLSQRLDDTFIATPEMKFSTDGKYFLTKSASAYHSFFLYGTEPESAQEIEAARQEAFDRC
jgi:hypothetical protein